jgi:hypothetical protein
VLPAADIEVVKVLGPELPVQSRYLVSLTVTTPLPGTETETLLPDSAALVDANMALLLVTQEEAAPGVKPLKDTRADWLEDPLLVKTTTTEPSVLTKAPVMTLVMEPDVATR